MKGLQNQVDNCLFDKITQQREKNFPGFKNSNFPEIFPLDIKKYLEKSALSIGVNYDSLAMSLFGNASIAIGGNKIIQLTEEWKEKAILWIALVGESGVGKTPILQSSGKAILDKMQADIYKNSQDQKRFFTTNATVEAICRLHQDNPAGIGISNDELSMFLDGKGQYKRGGGNDQAFYLQSWNGKGANFNDLVLETRFIENPYIPIVGGIQPDILSKIINDKNIKDGFASRFLYSFVELPERLLHPKEKIEIAKDISPDEWKSISKLINRFIEARDNREVFVLSKGAEDSLLDYHYELEQEANFLSSGDILYSPIKKLVTYSIRLCLVVHLLDYKDQYVSKETVNKVIRLVEYLKQNTFKAYGRASKSEEEIFRYKAIALFTKYHGEGESYIEKEKLKHRLKKANNDETTGYKIAGKIIEKLLKDGILYNPNNNKNLIALKKR